MSVSQFGHVGEACPYEGTRKLVLPSGYTTKILCIGHAEHWARTQPGSLAVTPRNVFGEYVGCSADWKLPAEVP